MTPGGTLVHFPAAINRPESADQSPRALPLTGWDMDRDGWFRTVFLGPGPMAYSRSVSSSCP